MSKSLIYIMSYNFIYQYTKYILVCFPYTICRQNGIRTQTHKTLKNTKKNLTKWPTIDILSILYDDRQNIFDDPPCTMIVCSSALVCHVPILIFANLQQHTISSNCKSHIVKTLCAGLVQKMHQDICNLCCIS